MLEEIFIKNFAIIDDLRIKFNDGLTIISGKTGAGKSIIINAINLLLGSKASIELIRTGEEMAELEAFFNISSKSNTYKIMQEQGYNPSEGLLVRRIIARNYKHRNYINGRLSTVQSLKLITANLASIAGQHANQSLLNEENHIQILDQFGKLFSLRNRLKKKYQEILPKIKKLKELKDYKNNQINQIDYLKFQQKEIVDANISKNEDEELEQEKNRLKNWETLYYNIQSSIEELYDSKGAIHERLEHVKKNLLKASQVEKKLEIIVENISDITYKIQDITVDLRSNIENFQYDEKRLEDIELRLNIIWKLKKKYGGSIDSIIHHHKTVSNDLLSIENSDDKISEIENEIEDCRAKIIFLAKELSCLRKEVAKKMAKKVDQELSSLKMPSTNFKVCFKDAYIPQKNDAVFLIDGKAITEDGVDQVLFQIAPNVGEELKPLKSVASGGELARVVLALKAVFAASDSLETVVFDEVDAGIGGGIAEVVGRKIYSLSNHHQIICITHLPQIAKFGEQHYKISKHVSKGRTHTTIKILNNKERIEEVARMLGGEEITEITRNHAVEILNRIY